MADVDLILSKLDQLEKKISLIPQVQAVQEPEIIDSSELTKRLGLSRASLITYRKNKTIPSIKIGASIRFNWPKVIEALEKKNGK